MQASLFFHLWVQSNEGLSELFVLLFMLKFARRMLTCRTNAELLSNGKIG